MVDDGVSRTAIGTAYLRAAHQLFESQPLILDDPVVLSLLGPVALQRSGTRRNAIKLQHGVHCALMWCCVRGSLRTGSPQPFFGGLLSMGFDTFALRQPPWARSLKIFEVDHPGTQDRKRSLLAAAGLGIPPNAAFAAIDFEHESLQG
jgi:O-methyltransferase involved in polyketide biosynthesis